MSIDLLLSGPAKQVIDRFADLPEVSEILAKSWREEDADVLTQAYMDDSFLEAIQRQKSRPLLAVAMTQAVTHAARCEPLILTPLYRVFLSEGFHSALPPEIPPNLLPTLVNSLLYALMRKPGEALLEAEPPLVRRLFHLYQQIEFQSLFQYDDLETTQLAVSSACTLALSHPDLLPSYFSTLQSYSPAHVAGFARLVQKLDDYRVHLEKAFENARDPSFLRILEHNPSQEAYPLCGVTLPKTEED